MRAANAVRAPWEAPAGQGTSPGGAAGGSLDTDQIGVQRLAAVVDLDGDVGAMLGQPLCDPARLACARPVPLDQRHELVVVVQELSEQPAGGLGDRVAHD